MLILAGICGLYLVLTLVGLGWGLPTRAEDKYLFDGAVWSGARIAELSGGTSGRVNPEMGADVDVNPLTERRGAVVLNATPREQAEIYRRFRLFTYQPDEMITMMALSGMRPRALELDPKLYQYGGLYIYPVGGLIGLCGAVGLIPVHSDLTYYLDRPGAFGRFYVVARLYAAAWGLIGVLVVYGIGRRLAGRAAGLIAALLFVLLPVVVCMSHEAKPHLPGAVLMLSAVWFGMRVIDRPTRWNWVGLFVCCGAAEGMVLSSLPIFVVIPVVAALHVRRNPADQNEEEVKRHRLAWARFLKLTIGGWAMASVVYLLTNPYVVINALVNRAVLASNFGNSLAMYEISRVVEGAGRMLTLTVEGATWPVLAGGLLAAIVAIVRRRADALVLGVPAAVLIVQFVLIGAGKPDEYGRFGVFQDCALAIGCGCVLGGVLSRRRLEGAVLTTLVALICGFFAGGYLWSFYADAHGLGSRTVAAERLAKQLGSSVASAVAVAAEPAPYGCPPLDFSSVRVVMYRHGPEEKPLDRIRIWNAALRGIDTSESAPPGVLVAALDDPKELQRIKSPSWSDVTVCESRRWPLPRSRITWANKPFVILSRLKR